MATRCSDGVVEGSCAGRGNGLGLGMEMYDG